jgi:hypothetical protein
LAGNLAAADPGVQKDLAVTDAQKSSIKTLMQKAQDANRAVFDKMRNGDIDREEFPQIMRQNAQILKDELGKILTDDQKAKIKAMSGKPFTATEQGPGGGFGGPPPGGGGGFGGG